MSWGKTASAIAIAAGLGGCAYGPEPTMHRVRDHDTKQIVPGLAVLSSGDPCSGPIQSVLLQQRYAYGPFEPLSRADGPGTCQTVVSSILPAAAVATSGALYPAAKTIISNVGNSRATGGSAAGGAGGVASASSRARGGNANATGGNASLKANLQNHQNATAQSDAAASTGPIDVRGGGIIPNGTVLHTPGGDVVVDPTVSVSQ